MVFETKYVILAAAWLFWCVVHSLLISTTVTSFLETRLGSTFRFYRLAFNIFSILTFAPVLQYSLSLRAEPVFVWDGWLELPRLLLIVLGGLCLVGGAMRYDLLLLVGIRQMLTNTASSSLAESGEINARGILGVVRHPWYIGVLVLVWARDLCVARIIVSSIISIYLVVGTLLEERKLCREFGEGYREYQNQVSMFFPWKYIRRRLRIGSPGPRKE